MLDRNWPYVHALAGTEDLVARGLLDLVPQALATAEPRPVSSVYSDVSLELAEQFNVSLKGEASPEGSRCDGFKCG